MKFIHTGEVIDQLQSRPDLLNDKYIVLVLRMIAWETYTDSGARSKKWLDVARGGDPTIIIHQCNPSPSLEILLAYAILKHDDPQSPWSIHVGTYENSEFDVDVYYLQSRSPADTTVAGMMYVGDIPVDQNTVVMNLTEENIIEGSLVLDDDPICVASEFLRYDPKYRHGVGKDSAPLPCTKGEIMKWLRSERVIDDDNVKDVSSVIDDLLAPGSDFVLLCHALNVCEGVQSVLLRRSIMKMKAIKGINMILDQYPPIGCVVPTTTFDV